MRALRRVLIGLGALVMAYAGYGILTDADVNPVGVAVFLAAVLVVDDGVVLPVVIAVGAVIGRLVPSRDRATVRVAALCTAAVTAVALPLVLGYGQSADNPSALPLRYGRGLIVVLAAIWIGGLVVIAVRRIRKHLERDQPAKDR